MSNQAIKIGIIGLDTSHVEAFAKLLNDDGDPYHIEGGTVVAAYPGGSADFELSSSRVEGFTKKLKEQYHVQIVSSPEDVAEMSDAILLESVDGRVHVEQFKRVVPYGKPIFVDKPFAVSGREAEEIFKLADQHHVLVMSCSSLRYAEGLTQAIQDESKGQIIGMDCYGPMKLEPTQPGLFWYGIHTVEMLFTVMKGTCLQVSANTTEGHDVIVGTWADGRIGTIRGNRSGNKQFGALIHRETGSQFVDVYAHDKPYYASLLEKIMVMFTKGTVDINRDETRQIIRFIEAANESRKTGEVVKL